MARSPPGRRKTCRQRAGLSPTRCRRRGRDCCGESYRSGQVFSRFSSSYCCPTNVAYPYRSEFRSVPNTTSPEASMKFILPLILVIVTVGLMVFGLTETGQAGGTVGIAAGSALLGLTPSPSTPDQALANLLVAVQRRNWDQAFSGVATSSGVDEQSFIEDWTGSNGSLRSFSNLEGFD